MNKVFIPKLTVLQLVKKYFALYGTGMFITIYTTTRHLKFVNPVYAPHPTPPHHPAFPPYSFLNINCNMYFNPRLDFPGELILSGFSTTYTLPSTYLILIDLITSIMFG
jgi:hypothetical protein